MPLTADQQAAFDTVKAGVAEIKQVVQDSLSIQAMGGYHVFNLALALEKKMEAVENA